MSGRNRFLPAEIQPWKTYDQKFTLTTKKSLHIIFKLYRNVVQTYKNHLDAGFRTGEAISRSSVQVSWNCHNIYRATTTNSV